MEKRPIAIIGGMGPEASAYFYNILIKQSIDLFGAVNNDDFPEIILHSIPVPDFISSNKRTNEALEMLKERIVKLNKFNPLCIAIACNTAHILLDNLQKVAHSPFTSIIDEVVKAVKKDGFTTIGLLGTPSTIKSNIYQDAFGKVGINTITLNNNMLNILERIIRNIIAGKTKKEDQLILKRFSDLLISKGAQSIVLGCTELPLIFPKNYKKKVYNSLKILSQVLLHKYYSQNQFKPAIAIDSIKL